MRAGDELVDLFAANTESGNTRHIPTSHSTHFRFAPWVNSLLGTGEPMGKYLLLLFLFFSLVISNEVIACDCMWNPLITRVDKADVVLIAEITGQKTSEFVELQPVEVFKGNIPLAFAVQTGTSDCDLFNSSIKSTNRERYLLFLKKSQDYYVTTICHGSGHLEWKQSKADLPELRKLFMPDAQPVASADRKKRGG